MSNNIIRLNQDLIYKELKELVRGSVKETLNTLLAQETRQKIADRGLKGELDIFPVENVAIKRPRYWNDGTIDLFKVHMWNINSMNEEDSSRELDARIDAACRYFKL